MWWILPLAFLVNGQSPRGQAVPFIDPSNCSRREYFTPYNYSCISCPLNLISSSDHLTCQCPSNSIPTNLTAAGFTCQQCNQNEVVLEGICLHCSSNSCNCSSNEILQSNGCASCPVNFKPNEDRTKCIPCLTVSCLCQNGMCSSDRPEVKTDIWLSEESAVRSVFIEGQIRAVLARCQQGSNQDCQALLNMCVLQHFDRSTFTSCFHADRVIPQLMMNLILDGDMDSELRKESIQPAYTMNQELDIIIALFHANGSFIKMESLQTSNALLCSYPEKTIKMGRRFSQLCPLTITSLEAYKGFFAEFFIRFLDENGVKRVYPIPVLNKQMRGNSQLINRDGSNRQQLVRRFFIVDNSAYYSNLTRITRFLSSMELQIFLQPTREGTIFPPLLVIDYSETTKQAASSFSVIFLSDPDRHDRDLEITMSVMCPTSIIWAGIKAYSWGRRSGKQLISDASVVIQFFLFSATCLGEVPSIIAIWLTFSYKLQYYYFYNTLSVSQEDTLRIYLLFAVILKLIGVIQKILQLITQRTLFIDWERPRTVVDMINKPPSQDATKSLKELPPIAWRTYMVANEWNELFRFRKTSITIQILAVLLLLETFGWKYWALVEPGFSCSFNGSLVETNLTKFGIYVAVYLAVAFFQWTLQVLLLERIIIDPFHNFIDLCSVANISVMSLTHSLYGYYIHGRSVHGRGDVSMGEMNEFLKREKDNLTAHRGLEPGTELQTYQVALPASFHDKLESINNNNSANSNGRGFDQFTAKMDKTTQKHEVVNSLVIEFIDHSLNDIDYITRDATFVESLFDVETIDTTFTGHFTRDASEMTFSRCFLYGNEWSFLSFEVSLFCLLALWFNSILPSCAIVFIISSFIRLLTSLIAKNQLAKVSYVDNRFLL